MGVIEWHPFRCTVSWCDRFAVARVEGWWVCRWHAHLLCETLGDIDVRFEHTN